MRCGRLDPCGRLDAVPVLGNDQCDEISGELSRESYLYIAATLSVLVDLKLAVAN